MELLNFLQVTELLIAVGIVVSVLLQSRSAGLGNIFGGGGGGTFKSRRGTEALLFNATMVLGVAFAVVAIAIAIIDVRTI